MILMTSRVIVFKKYRIFEFCEFLLLTFASYTLVSLTGFNGF